jgi:type VI secretion system secreted protein VgrG
MSDAAKNQPHATLSIAGKSYHVRRVRGSEGLSKLFRYDVTVLMSEGEDPKGVLSQRGKLRLTDAFGQERIVRGVVAEARVFFDAADTPTLQLALRPEAFPMTLGRDSRVFQDMSVVDIVKSVCSEAGVRARFEMLGAHAPRVYTAQYRESNWSFVSRLCEEEGIYCWFDHEEGKSIVVFADTSTSAPDLVGGRRISYVTDSDTSASRESIEELGPVVQMTSTRFELGSFDPSNPRYKVGAKAGEGEHVVYDAPGGGPEDEKALEVRAASMSGAAAAQRARVRGSSTSARLVPGRIVQVLGHPTPRFDRAFLVTDLEVEVDQRVHRDGHAEHEKNPGARARQLLARFESRGAGGSFREDAERIAAADDEIRFVVTFGALASNVPFRAPFLTATPKRPGLQSGVVVGPPGEEVFPDESSRVRVQLHWDRRGQRDDKAGRWMRVAQRGTAGSMLMPRMGWNVLTMNHEGAPDAPMVLSRVFDAEHPPPYALPANMTRTTFKTETTPGGGSSNEIRYEDRAGSEEMFVNASRDMNVLVQNAKSEDVKSNSVHTVAANHSLEVGQNLDETIGGNQVVSVGANDTETVGKARLVSAGKDESTIIGGSRSLKVAGSHETSVVGSRDLSVGIAQMDVSLGDIKVNTAMLKEFVGVALVRLTPFDIKEDVGVMTLSAVTAVGMLGLTGGAAAAATAAAGLVKFSVGAGGVLQTIGGAKLELCMDERSITTLKAYKETVGGMMQIKAGKTFTDQALKSSIDGGRKLVARSKTTLRLEAETMVEIVCGASKIKITKEEVRIHSTKVNLKGSIIEAKGDKIESNV